MKLDTGVYFICNRVNGRVYIGSSSRSLQGRLRAHRDMLRGGRHYNIHLQAAWDKYGEGSFLFLILERCEPSKCVEREQAWMDRYDAFRSGYNRSPVAGSRRGAVLSGETRAKIGAGNRGKNPSAETRAKMSATRRGRKQSQSHRDNCRANHWSHGPNAAIIAAKIAAANLGQRRSPAVCAAISAGKLKHNRGRG